MSPGTGSSPRRFEEHRKQWEAERAEEAKRLACYDEQLEADCRDLERQRREWEMQRKAEERRLEERAEQLYARRVELEFKRRALEEPCHAGFSPQEKLSEWASRSHEQESQTPADIGGLGPGARDMKILG